MTTRTFTFEEGSSSKFWEVTVADKQLTIRFGRLGATGQTQVKSFSSHTAATGTAEALIRSKVKKGYVEGRAPKQAAAAPTAAKKPAAAKKPPPPEKLLKAFTAREPEKVKALVEAGVDVNARFPGERTPLHLAVSQGDHAVELVELLAARGADLEARDDERRTPYMLTGSVEVRRALKKAGARGLDEVNGSPLKPKTRKGNLREPEVDGGALGVDGAGNLWFAGHDGINRWDGKVLTRFEFQESFSVERILPGAKGLLYFSTNWGIVTFDGKAWRLVSIEDSELHDGHITDFAVDRAGVAYALGYGSESTVDRPISRYDGKAVTVLTAGVDFPRGLETNVVAFDPKNRMVFLTQKGIVFPDGKRWPSDKDVARAEFSGDTVWADCGYFGLFRRAGSSTKEFDFEDGVDALCLDGKTMWVGNAGGLHRIDGNEVTRVAGFEDGVEALALGKNGTLWVNSGGLVFSYRDGVVRTLAGKEVKAAPPEEG